MQKSYRFFLSFLFCFFLAVVIFSLQKTGIISGVSFIVQGMFAPIQKTAYGIATGFPWVGQDKKQIGIQSEVDQKNQLASYQTMARDNQALKDQFELGSSYQSQLLVARVLGAPRFVPGVTSVDTFIIDKGARDGVKVGQGVIIKGELVGKLVRVGTVSSVVQLVTNAAFSLPVRITRSGALGVLHGTGNGDMLLDNVLLAEDIKAGDLVVTYGDLTESDTGLPSDIVIGEILSVDKKPSALFQTAKLKTLQSLEKITLVFIVVGGK